ncbi:MAG: hypothetical protein JWM86_430 [Thermoleophilia bacterium]|nr:hypothetical protein [Thermoleophilia bacterium]
MRAAFADTVPLMKASSIQAGAHVSAAGDAAMRIPHEDTGTDRVLAAARIVDELDHAVGSAQSVPGAEYIPHASDAFRVYGLASRVLRAAAGTRVADRAHPVLGAAELLAANDHVTDAVALHAAPGASEIDHLRAASLLDAAISDAQSGFAYLDHPATEGRVVAALQGARASVGARGPIDPAPVATAQGLLVQAANEALGRTPAAPAVAVATTPVIPTAPVAAPRSSAPIVFHPPSPQSVARVYAATVASHEVHLNLPKFVLPTIPAR